LKRIAYSTCSIHQRENEDVVAAVLPAALELGFRLVDPFPAWHRKGLEGVVEGWEKLVRTDAAEDGTDGFFVAVFEKA
jgi:putative methyltransferase